MKTHLSIRARKSSPPGAEHHHPMLRGSRRLRAGSIGFAVISQIGATLLLGYQSAQEGDATRFTVIER
jgi:hypothetical protein